ncbi:hypothetical protein [Mycobacteroides chelonae]|nr:hypothetical protein [Mycobacteroides chelonae]MEC4837170.1 hypothetical protein [Mycobacteroides chelonae]MEC4839182.1 hypothetical protein [Mycobacteroides chelonae]MEC4844704.1 hypothetical protein [Mycobacteroides chelonae]MEC4858720.1 hypothetical protein [Mycobacteroides chelonae]MEC4870254.1 hypothetical protein [Mycobacteroides chelonae]
MTTQASPVEATNRPAPSKPPLDASKPPRSPEALAAWLAVV